MAFLNGDWNMSFYDEIETDDPPPTLMYQRRHTDPFRQDKEIAIAKLKEYQKDTDKERALGNMQVVKGLRS